MSNLLHTTQLIYILVFLAKSTGERAYEIILLDFNCTASKEYVSNFSCSLVHPKAVNVHLHIIKEIKKPFISLDVDLIRQNRKTVSLFSFKDLDVCHSMKHRFSQAILSLVKRTFVESDAWICPVPAGFHYNLRNFTVDPDLLPGYIPEGPFNISFVFLADNSKIMVSSFDIFGRFVYKKIRNGRKNFPK